MRPRLPKTKGVLRREAAAWLARLQSGRDPDVEARFRRWRDSDPRNAEAFDRVRSSYQQAGLLRHSSIVRSGQSSPSRRKPEWRPFPALAVTVGLLVLVPAALLVLREGAVFGGTEAVMLMTTVGEIREVDLADGSKVTLDTSTKVEVEIGRSRRSARLRYGRARFRIAPAGAPFVIDTSNATIESPGGVVDVEQGTPNDRVQVLGGAAQVRVSDRGRSASVALAAGEVATVGTAGIERRDNAAPAPDWTRGMLQFDGTPLGEAVELANRYSARHVLLVGDLGELRVTGAFRAGDTSGLARAIAAAFGLSLQERADGTLILSRSPRLKKNGG